MQQPMLLTVAFEGFCMFKRESSQVSVFTPEGKAGHLSMMTALTTAIDISNTTWVPDYMVTPPGAAPIYIWELNNHTVHVGNGGDPGWPAPDALKSIIRFDEPGVHPNAKHDSKRSRRTNGHVMLHGGNVAPNMGAVYCFDWLRDGQVVKENDCRAEVINWAGEPMVSNDDKRKIAFKEAQVHFTVSNTRPGVNGLRHFHEYYEHLKLADGDRPLEIRYTPTTARSPRYGNCVPAGVLPDAES